MINDYIGGILKDLYPGPLTSEVKAMKESDVECYLCGELRHYSVCGHVRVSVPTLVRRVCDECLGMLRPEAHYDLVCPKCHAPCTTVADTAVVEGQLVLMFRCGQCRTDCSAEWEYRPLYPEKEISGSKR